MPKATKNTNTVNDSVDMIKQDWLKVVKEITDSTEKLEQLCKRRDELVSQLWTHLNKDPASTVVDGDNDKAPEKTPTKAPAKKGGKVVALVDDEEDVPTPAPIKKAPPKKGKATTAADENEDGPTPAPAKKVPAKKGAKSTTTAVKPADEDEADEQAPAPAQTKAPAKKPATTPAKAPAKKAAAPPKGTPKPKLEIDSEDVNINEDPSSEDTDLDSLSSVSSESDASGGEDN